MKNKTLSNLGLTHSIQEDNPRKKKQSSKKEKNGKKNKTERKKKEKKKRKMWLNTLVLKKRDWHYG